MKDMKRKLKWKCICRYTSDIKIDLTYVQPGLRQFDYFGNKYENKSLLKIVETVEHETSVEHETNSFEIKLKLINFKLKSTMLC